MDIIKRNFLRLLRAAIFDKREPLEPMSAWKWNQLYKMTNRHHVEPWIDEGIGKYQGDFFLPRSSEQTRFQLISADVSDENTDTGLPELSNPILSQRLEQLRQEHGTSDATFELLTRLLNMACHIFQKGLSLRQIILLGTYLHTTKDPLDYEVLNSWLRQLRMVRTAQLAGSLLAELLGMDDEEIAFTDVRHTKRTHQIADELLDSDSTHRYVRYFPEEALTHFTANIVQNLKDIEE